MFVIRIIIEFYILFCSITQIKTLVQLPTIDDSDIALAETVIRNTVNDLFAAFKIPGLKHRTKIKQLSAIHNFFVSITLTDCDNLKKIARLSTVNKIDSTMQYFIAEINEVLNEGDKNIIPNEDENNIYVATYIEKFIKKLKHWKDTHVSYPNTAIKSDILKYMLKDKKTLINVTKDDMNLSMTDEHLMEEDKFRDDEYWHADSRRLFQGVRTSIKRYPFMASIHVFNKFQCAGSIIKNDLIITSSSCLQIAWNNRYFRENPAFLSVRVGCNYYDLCGENIAVLEIYFHPQYEPKTLKHNLAIVRLTRQLNFRFSKGHIKKIDFDKNPWELPVNSKVTIVGWGAKDVTNVIKDVFKNKLSYADLEYFPMEDCQNYYSKTFVSHYNFCAGFYTRGGGACRHDGGGPGVQNSLLVGVISFGSPMCGAPSIPTVFTKLGFYADWIEDILEKEPLYGSFRTTTKSETTNERIYTLVQAQKSSTTKKLISVHIRHEDTPISTVNDAEASVLRVPQDQAIDDFLSIIFEEKNKGYSDTSDSEVKGKLTKNQPIDSKVEYATLTKEKLPEDIYTKKKTKSPTKKNTKEAKLISAETIESLEDSSAKKEIQGMSIESATESLKKVTEAKRFSAEMADSSENSSAKEDIVGMSIESTTESKNNSHNPVLWKGGKINTTKTTNNVKKHKKSKKVKGRSYKNSTVKVNTSSKEITADSIITTVQSIGHFEGSSIKDESDELLNDTITGTYNENIKLTKVRNDDKTLEEDIKKFIDDFDFNTYMIPQPTLSAIEDDSPKPEKEKEINKTLGTGEDSPVPRALLDLLFFSDENTDDSENDEGLSII